MNIYLEIIRNRELYQDAIRKHYEEDIYNNYENMIHEYYDNHLAKITENFKEDIQKDYDKISFNHHQKALQIIKDFENNLLIHYNDILKDIENYKDILQEIMNYEKPIRENYLETLQKVYEITIQEHFERVIIHMEHYLSETIDNKDLYDEDFKDFLDDKVHQMEGHAFAKEKEYPLKKFFKKILKNGYLYFSVNKYMKMGNIHLATTIICNQKELIQKIYKISNQMIEDTKIHDYMTVKLKGENFKIVALNNEDQILIKNNLTCWKWNVIPTKSGLHDLILVVSARIKVEDEVIDLPIRTKTIKVRVNIPYLMKKFTKENWQWIVGALGGSGVLWGIIKNFFLHSD
jgi:hypothetical protein